MPNGTKVIVLKPGIYSDGNHRANPPAEIGDVIEVAGGTYVERLEEQGKVSPFDPSDFQETGFETEEIDLEDIELGFDDEESEEPLSEEPSSEDLQKEVDSRHGNAWKTLKEAGVTDTAARALWAKGIRSKHDVRVTQKQPAGKETLIALKGVGPKTVDALYEWAGEAEG